MADLTIYALSKAYVKVPVVARKNGAPFDPSADTVQMAFTEIAAEPASGDWQVASWEVAGAGTANAIYYARCLVGTGGDVSLPAGLYLVWVKITDTPEVPVLQSGTLQVA